MKISVIIPVFNSELYLDDLFLSLSQQTLQDFEIIAIDDASSDQSFTILQKWQRKFANKMKIVHNPVNLGVGASRNIGLKLAKGEYISFIDSDDFIHPNMFYDLYYGALEYHFPEVLSTGIVFTKNLDHPGDFHSTEEKERYFLLSIIRLKFFFSLLVVVINFLEETSFVKNFLLMLCGKIFHFLMLIYF